MENRTSPDHVENTNLANPDLEHGPMFLLLYAFIRFAIVFFYSLFLV